MNKSNPVKQNRETPKQRTKQQLEHPQKMQWEPPKMEDVSEQVMAQPYIRFT